MPKKVTEAAIHQHLTTLTTVPARIATCIQSRDEIQLRTPPASNEWSAVEIIAHLRGCADVWSYSIYAMLTLDSPELTYIHPRDWSKKLNYAALSFAENFQTFEVERRKLLHVLETLSFEDWNRSATFRGRANVYTVFGETLRMAEHDLDHCQQLEAMFLGK